MDAYGKPQNGGIGIQCPVRRRNSQILEPCPARLSGRKQLEAPNYQRGPMGGGVRGLGLATHRKASINHGRRFCNAAKALRRQSLSPFRLGRQHRPESKLAITLRMIGISKSWFYIYICICIQMYVTVCMYVCMILPRRLCLREGNRTHTSTRALGLRAT